MTGACRMLGRNLCVPLSKMIVSTKFRAPSAAAAAALPVRHRSDGEPNAKQGAFAEFYEKTKDHKSVAEEDQDFEVLLKNSNFINLGDPEGKQVIGTIFHVVDNDLYIDFGWKFHCVCSKPVKNADSYTRGSQVRLRIKSLELATRFLGSEKDLTLLEADAVLLGLHKSVNY